MENKEKTIDYYNENAQNYIDSTLNADISHIRNAFVSYISEGGKILDLGCGSGRDSKAFSDMGYKVTAMDGSNEMCEFAEKYTGQSVNCCLFQDYSTQEKFDGIWACASLMHMDFHNIQIIMQKFSAYLSERGCFYVSFKYGDYAGERHGRYYTDFNEDILDEFASNLEDLSLERYFITSDTRVGREKEMWLNALFIKQTGYKHKKNEIEKESSTEIANDNVCNKKLQISREKESAINYDKAIAALTQYISIGDVLGRIEETKEYIVQVPLKYREALEEGKLFLNKNSTTGVMWPTLMEKAENGRNLFVDNLPIKEELRVNCTPIQDLAIGYHNLYMQRQLADIADKVEAAYKTVKRIEQGQMDDRIGLLDAGREQIVLALSQTDEDDKKDAIALGRNNLIVAKNQIGIALKRKIEAFDVLPEASIKLFFAEVFHPGYMTSKDKEVQEIQDYYALYLEATKLLGASYVYCGEIGAAQQVFISSADAIREMNFYAVKSIENIHKGAKLEKMFYNHPEEYIEAEQCHFMEEVKPYDVVSFEIRGDKLLEVMNDEK